MLTKSQRQYIDRLRRKIGKTVIKHNLIENNDCVLVGVSGGKDSLILLDALTSKRSGIPISYKVIAVHIQVKNVLYRADVNFIRDFAQERGFEFHVFDINPDFDRDKKVSPCFICSWNRRAELFKLTKRFGCKKLAFGHHLDDAIETLLMNMAFNGEISALPYSVEMFNGRFSIIRPMLNIRERDLIRYAKLTGLDNKELKKCNFADFSRRETVKEIIKMFEKINPKAGINIFRSTNKIIDKYLPKLNVYEQSRRHSGTP